MGIILAFALAGGLAQLVDGTLGMGFGVTSATLLLLFGVAPAAASAGTHAAKLGTTFVSGIAHWRVGNVDTRTFAILAVPGAIGAFVGAVLLSGLSLASAKVWMCALLMFFGAVILARYAFGARLIPQPRNGHTARWLSPIGLLAGFVDATGGGGWGPVATPSLLTVTSHEPRRVVGTVNAAEFVVAAAASTGFLFGTARHDIPWSAVLGLVIGGMIVAPFAARLAGRMPQAAMGTMVGGLILVVNGAAVVAAVSDPGLLLGWSMVALAIVGTGVLAVRAWRRERAAAVPPHEDAVLEPTG